MTMSDKDIKDALNNKELEIKNFSEDSLQPASYDFRVGREGISSNIDKIINIEEDGFIIIEIGEFAVITTLEIFKLSNQIVGIIGMKSGLARKGLILLAGIHIDPGFHGILVLGLFNSGPNKIVLSYGQKIGTVEFSKLITPALKPYSGEYQDQLTIPPADIEFILAAKAMTMGNVIKSIQMLTKSVDRISTEMKGLKELFDRHEKRMGYIYGIILAVFSTVITIIITILAASP